MWYYANDGQDILDRYMIGIVFLLKWCIKILTYSPILLTGYFISWGILDKKDSAFAWMGLILLCSFLLYMLLYFVKGMLIGFKVNRNLLWLPLFILCTTYTSVLPVWLGFETIEMMMGSISENANDHLTWIASVSLGLYCYSRFHFLTDMAPIQAYPFYRWGMDLSLSLHKLSKRLPLLKAV